MFSTPSPNIKPSVGAFLNPYHKYADKVALALLFNEGGGLKVHDVSRHNHLGTLTDMGVDTWESDRPYGSKVTFNSGDDRILVPNAPSLNFSQHLTVIVGVEFASLPALNDGHVIVAKGASGETAGLNHNFLLTHENDVFGTGRGISWIYESTSGANQVTLDNFTPATNTFYQLIGTFDWNANIQRLYRDGILRDQTIHTTPTDQNISAISIGSFIPSGDAGSSLLDLDGSIHYLYLINASLSISEAASFYQNPFQLFTTSINTFLFGKVPAVAAGNEGAAMYHHLQRMGAY